jgi:hypothetical protein
VNGPVDLDEYGRSTAVVFALTAFELHDTAIGGSESSPKRAWTGATGWCSVRVRAVQMPDNSHLESGKLQLKV